MQKDLSQLYLDCPSWMASLEFLLCTSNERLLELCYWHWSRLRHCNLNENYQKTPMSITSLISKFTSAPTPWAAFTNSDAITLAFLLIRCSMKASRISLPVLFAHSRLYCLWKFRWWPLFFWHQNSRFLLRLFKFFLLISRIWCLCNSDFQIPNSGTTTKSKQSSVGKPQTTRTLPGSQIEFQEAIPSIQVPQTGPKLRRRPQTKTPPQKLPLLTRRRQRKTNNGRLKLKHNDLAWGIEDGPLSINAIQSS